jgi:hypothetical protein
LKCICTGNVVLSNSIDLDMLGTVALVVAPCAEDNPLEVVHACVALGLLWMSVLEVAVVAVVAVVCFGYFWTIGSA